jgi:hypothetical protein
VLQTQDACKKWSKYLDLSTILGMTHLAGSVFGMSLYCGIMAPSISPIDCPP